MKNLSDCIKSQGLTELSLLFDISIKLSDTLDLKAALKPILRMTAEHMEIPRGTLTILNRNRGEIVIEEAYGLRPEEQAKGRYHLGEGITGTVIDTGKAIAVPRISEEPLFLDRTGAREHLDKSDIAFICVPVKIGSETIGALSADRSSREASALDADMRLLTIIASTISQALRLRQLAQEEMEKVLRENERLQNQLKDRYRPKAIVGNSKIMSGLYELIETVARANTTVLILGESGVGKERVAHAIHYGSARADKPFVTVNCAALPESLIESELFGHEKGAFTGATMARKGRFELADRGTIFLDEIGELPPAVQTKLLRIIQEKEFERIGGNTTLKSDVRIIAATNRRSGESHQGGNIPGGPLLPAERLSHHRPAAARTPDGHHAPGRPLRAKIRPGTGEKDREHIDLRDRQADELSLAGERAGAGELHRAGGHPVRRRKYPEPPPSAEPADGCFRRARSPGNVQGDDGRHGKGDHHRRIAALPGQHGQGGARAGHHRADDGPARRQVRRSTRLSSSNVPPSCASVMAER